MGVCGVHFVFADITLVSQKCIYSLLVYIVDIKPVVLAHVSKSRGCVCFPVLTQVIGMFST